MFASLSFKQSCDAWMTQQKPKELHYISWLYLPQAHFRPSQTHTGLTAPIIEPYIFFPPCKEKKGHLSALHSWEHFCWQNRGCWGWVNNCNDTAVREGAEQKIKRGEEWMYLFSGRAEHFHTFVFVQPNLGEKERKVQILTLKGWNENIVLENAFR